MQLLTRQTKMATAIVTTWVIEVILCSKLDIQALVSVWVGFAGIDRPEPGFAFGPVAKILGICQKVVVSGPLGD